MKAVYFVVIACVFYALILPCDSLSRAASMDCTYDEAGRLIRVEYGNGAVIEYTYDRRGNVLKNKVSTLHTSMSMADVPGEAASAPDGDEGDVQIRLDGMP